jgi:hypothetical protein
LEQYWNVAPDEEVYEKIRQILKNVSPDTPIRDRNFVNKLNVIYKKMGKYEKHKFTVTAFDNGLEPRLRTMIDNYKYAYE